MSACDDRKPTGMYILAYISLLELIKLMIEFIITLK